jgi:hypothetical protein
MRLGNVRHAICCVSGVLVLAAVAVGGLAPGLASAAAAAASDPQGDVLSCTGECSLYDQDLKSISLSISGGSLLVTVTQYGPPCSYRPASCLGPFTKAQKLYWPQVDLFTTRAVSAPDFPFLATAPADYYVYVGYVGGSATYAMQLVHVAEGGWNAGHQIVESQVALSTPDQNSVVYTVPLADIGNPATIRARAWQGGTSDQGSNRIVDVVPDFSTGAPAQSIVEISSSGGSGSNSFGPGTGVTINGPARVLVPGGAVALSVSNRNGFPVAGTLSLVALAGRTAAAATAGLQAPASRPFRIGPHKTIKVSVRLTRPQRGLLASRHKLKVTAVAIVRDPSGHARTVKRTLTLVQRRG